MVLMALLATVFILPMIFGTKKYVLLWRVKSQLQQFESLEETVYSEVFKGKDFF